MKEVGLGRRDVVIVGAGPAGSALALALESGGMRVTVLERRAGGPVRRSAEARAIALAESSRRILATLGAWSEVAVHASAIREIHVSDRGHFGFTRMRAADRAAEAFGWVVDADTLSGVLQGALDGHERIEVLRPCEVGAVEQDSDHLLVHLAEPSGAQSGRLEASLVVFADGGRTPVAASLGLQGREHDYRQSALTATVEASRPHRHVAFERFTDEGPLALLPLRGAERCSLVWTMDPERAHRLARAGEQDFLSRLEEAFGTRLGGFRSSSTRRVHELRGRFVARPAGRRCAAIANAAQTLHPVAGQGLNLGLRDVAWLAQTLLDAHRAGTDAGARPVLDRYLAARSVERWIWPRVTDGLVSLYTSRFAPLGLARDVAMVGLDLLPPLKRWFAAQAMGLRRPQPRLVRGLAA